MARICCYSAPGVVKVGKMVQPGEEAIIKREEWIRMESKEEEIVCLKQTKKGGMRIRVEEMACFQVASLGVEIELTSIEKGLNLFNNVKKLKPFVELEIVESLQDLLQRLCWKTEKVKDYFILCPECMSPVINHSEIKKNGEGIWCFSCSESRGEEVTMGYSLSRKSERAAFQSLRFLELVGMAAGFFGLLTQEVLRAPEILNQFL